MISNRIYTYYRTYPAVFLAGCLIIGILIGRNINSIIPAFMLMLICGLLLIVAGRPALTWWLVLVIGCGWLGSGLDMIERRAKSKAIHHFQRNQVRYRGVVNHVSSSSDRQRIEMINLSLVANGQRYTGAAKFLVYLEENLPVAIGDTVSGSGRFYELAGKRNPGDFDFRSYYQRQNIFGRIYQGNKTNPVIYPDSSVSARRTLDNIRQAIRLMIDRQAGGQAGGLVNALILGDKSGIDPDTRDAFIISGVVHVLAVSGLHVGYVLLIFTAIGGDKSGIDPDTRDAFIVSGVVHVLAVSGLHVGYVLLIFTALGRILRLPWGWDKLMVILALMAFATLTGGKPSVVRATLMAAVYVLAPLVNRNSNLANIIAVSALVLLLIKPDYIVDPGFLLSFTAVISIVIFYNLFNNLLPLNWRVNEIKNPGLKTLWGLTLVSLSAQLGTLPLTIMYFQRIPVIALLANLMVVPLVGVLVACGFLLLLVGWFPLIGFIVGSAAKLVAETIIILTSGLARIPNASLNFTQPDWLDLTVYLALVSILFLIKYQKFSKVLIISLVTANLVVWQWAVERDTMDLVFMDVGQGDACLIVTPDHQAVLIDAGEKNYRVDMGSRVVLPVLRQLSVERIKYLVMTHPHSDHIGGVTSVLNEVSVDTIWDTTIDHHSQMYDDIKTQLQVNETALIHPFAGDTRWLFPALHLAVLLPDSAYFNHLKSINNRSIIIKLIYGTCSFLLMADLEQEGEEILCSLGGGLKADILKAGHHGSITSTRPRFLDLVDPEIAVISVGTGNKFQHPSATVISRLTAAGVQLHRTDRQQALWLRSDGRKIWKMNWK